MSIISAISVFPLSNSALLNKLLGPEPFDFRKGVVDWQLEAYVASARRDSSRPDHVFKHRWENFSPSGIKSGYVWLPETLKLVADEYFEYANGRLYIKAEAASVSLPEAREEERGQPLYNEFGRWQNMRTRMTILPVKAWSLTQNHRPLHFFCAHPRVPALEQYIKEFGLNEAHLHLNGCLYPEECWLFDLFNVPTFLKWNADLYKNNHEMREWYAVINPELTPKKMAERLRLALVLRDYILELVEMNQRGCPTAPLARLADDACRDIESYKALPFLFKSKAPYHRPKTTLAERMQEELVMWRNVFELLSAESDFPQKFVLNFLLHLYLLIQNEHCSLNRHNEEFKGFSVFDRANSHEKQGVGSDEYYVSCFKRLLNLADAKGHNCIEVRVSPKAFKNTKRRQLVQCWRVACEKRKAESERWSLNHAHHEQLPKLILVAHFIKRTSQDEKVGSLVLNPLYEDCRRAYLAEAEQLGKDARWLTQHDHISVGIDAAASELKLPPEVFAPAYRRFEELTHISYRTYHCGEDFHHLIGGVRAVYEAVVFLNLKDGNRVGHATAIGIRPKYWMDTMPARLIIKRREWFLDLIFAWNLLRDERTVELSRLEQEIARLQGLLFSHDENSPLSLQELVDFSQCRHFMPSMVNKCLDGKVTVSLPKEMALVQQFKKAHGTTILEYFRRWNMDRDCRSSQEEWEEVKTDFLPPSALVLLQQKVQRLLVTRGVAVEALPVSNLRISQYKDIQQHHILRWLQVKSCVIEGDSRMNICIGSDDPGVFVTDIKNEYYHLYVMLRNAGLSDAETMEKIREVNENGRIFAFRELPYWDPEKEGVKTMLRTPYAGEDGIRRLLRAKED